jgi:non-heme chloroperoxidase
VGWRPPRAEVTASTTRVTAARRGGKMRRPVPSASSSSRRTFTFAAPDGARLAYHIVGEPPPRVLLVHGWMTSGRVWDQVLPALAAHGPLVVDLRGAGASGACAAGITLDRLVDDLVAVVDHAGLARFHLVGHSMGGQLAQLLAARAPGRLRSLALLNPVPVAGLPLPAPVADSFRAAGGQRAVFDGILDAACRQLPAEARALLLDEALAIAPAVIAEVFDAWTAGSPAPVSPPPSMTGVPTLVLATDDPFLPRALLADAVAARFPGAALEHLPGPGHYPQLEHPAATAALLAALWARA